MKVYYFLFNLEKADFDFFLERTWMISDASDIPKIIEDHFFRIGDQGKERTKKTDFLEALMFLEVFLAKGLGSIDDVEWVHAKNFLILNDQLYEFNGTAYARVDDDILFVTTRDSWRNPFFSHMHIFLSGKVRLMRPNLQARDNQADKLASISKLWHMRETCVGDIIIPLLRNKHADHIGLLLDFAKTHIGDRVVIKNNLGVEGQKVRALNLTEPRQKMNRVVASLKEQFFDIGVRGPNNPYIVRHYHIVKEFRIYFTYAPSGCIKIYSVKNRENTAKDGQSVFEQTDFTRQSLDVVWHYQHPDDFCRHERAAFDLCNKIIPLLGAEIGVLELCREENGSVRFLEINHLGGALLHPGQDEALMREYYRDMWAGLIAKL